MKERETLKVNNLGHLEIGGCDTVDLVVKYGTPLYVMDEAYIRKICRSYTEVLSKKYPNSLVCYASKAFSTKAIYAICKSENLGADVVSAGELLTAISAGMSGENLYFHGNGKTPYELQLAVENNVHAVVVDSEFEIDMLDFICAHARKKIGVMVRVNPGIDAHTHKFIQTTKVDSKFGFSIADGTAEQIIKRICSKNNLNFLGVHCHIGSQIFEIAPFELAVEKMTDFIASLNKNGIEVNELNLGGGYGVHYTDEDRPLKPYQYVDAIVDKLNECISIKKIKSPRLILEPGRSIVGEAGITLYTVGAVKEIKDVKKYVSINGGMFENPRYALYDAKYEVALANRMSEEKTDKVTVAGKCCESGDMIAVDVMIPPAKPGDVLAVFTTGAYNYSMASNYNRNVVPPVVMVNGGESEYVVRPQSYEDLMARDEIPSWIKK
jgi:diaminopimelate decarboxylase